MEYEKLVDRFIQETDKKFDILHARHDKSDEKIDLLLEFKWRLAGSTVVISGMIAVLIQVAINYAGK